MMTRRDLLSMAASGALARGAARQPNIVFIMLDDLGYGDLGCYGQRRIRTPNIDRIAAEGMRFTDAYAGGSVCAPSRSVLMTGLHMGHTPVRANAGTVSIEQNDVTLAEVLKSAGYATGGFGKWGLGDHGTPGVPYRQGFDEFFGYLHQVHAHSYYPHFLWDNDRKFPMGGTKYSADVIAERSFDFLKRQSAAKPFFLYATYTVPHARFEVPDLGPYVNEPWPETDRKYAAMISRGDSYTGRLLALLEEKKLAQDTIVIFTSDNGGVGGGERKVEFFGSTGNSRGEKGQLYEGGIRVPLMVRWPGQVKAGSVSDLPCYFADMLPTFAEIARAKTPDVDGISIVPELRGKRLSRERTLYWERHAWNGRDALRLDRMGQATRFGDWKMVRQAPDKEPELYDLRSDPGEKSNVANAQPDRAAKLSAMMQAAHRPPRAHAGNMKFIE